MMHYKNKWSFFLTLLLLVSNASCQNLEKMGESEKRFKEIPKEIKKYENPIKYYISTSGLRRRGNVEVYVNDMPMIQYFGDANGGGFKSINQYILKSGKQQIRVVYTKSTPYKGDFSGDIDIRTLLKGENFGDKAIKVVDYTTPREIVEDWDTYGDFVGEGLMEFTDTIEFEAEVPYELEGWSESEDLSKLDKDKLLKETVGAYANFKKIVATQDRESFFNISMHQ